MSASGIFILPSHQKGFSNARLEPVGVTIVATDVGGNSEAIEHGVSGLIVPSEDPEALGDAIVTLANDRAKRLEYLTAAAERARVHFSLNSYVDCYGQLYINFWKTVRCLLKFSSKRLIECVE